MQDTMNKTNKSKCAFYYVKNTVTGEFWNGKSFESFFRDAVAIPAHGVPVMRATWSNCEFVPAGAQVTENACEA
jgi:hypothetical protein